MGVRVEGIIWELKDFFLSLVFLFWILNFENKF
jgi:hypothetical protein